MSSPAQPQARERAPTPQGLHLTLFVSGASPASARTEARLRALCERHCPAGYDLRIVDIYREPEIVDSRGVLAVPTLIKDLPLPVRVLIGDLTAATGVLDALGLPNGLPTDVPSHPN